MPIDIFIKRGGSLEVQHQKAESFDLAHIKRKLDEVFGAGHLFLEDGDEPIAADHKVEGGSIFVHHNRCKQIEVTVRYAGKAFEHGFTPGTTLKKIKRRAEKKLDIDPADAVELSLQLAGTTERPDEATHVGSLAQPKTCAVAFDLVPSDRING
ncbi:hypothetical protein [Sphingopyxis alaskensis]|uniref:Uncharacterized protein n=1 Tax=Sphingopyxis alaskensis (strain DSM 13593 / LMG 18877 / RB2256) TaxID=317655 RepID=Q1GX42_SPHAL|nr:hypothetical protein [Sphingopyxis alaskensis]ABF51780.1 hypothetical protein Sala_0054 [Sphingopyxis alaskensis RB2256]